MPVDGGDGLKTHLFMQMETFKMGNLVSSASNKTLKIISSYHLSLLP